MVDRMFGVLDVLMTEDMVPRRDEYMERIQNTPPPWTVMQKALFEAQLERLQGDLDMWNEYVTILEDKASRMRNQGDQATLYFRIDTWKRTHKTYKE